MPQQPTPQTGPSAFEKLVDFLTTLERVKMTYRLSHFRADAITVELAIPGERWEVEFFADGTVEVERFRSLGDTSTDEAVLTELIRNYVDGWHAG
jgi:hypothetical protein